MATSQSRPLRLLRVSSLGFQQQFLTTSDCHDKCFSKPEINNSSDHFSRNPTIIRPILFYGNMQRELDIPSKLISGELALIIGSFFLKSQTTHLLEKGLARM